MHSLKLHSHSLRPIIPSLSLFSLLINTHTQVMDGRFFANKRVEAYIADGNEKFKKSSERKGAAVVDFETETTTGAVDADAAADEEGKRLDRFGEWLEG